MFCNIRKSRSLKVQRKQAIHLLRAGDTTAHSFSVLVHILLAVVTSHEKPVVSPEICMVCEQLTQYNIQPFDFTLS